MGGCCQFHLSLLLTETQYWLEKPQPLFSPFEPQVQAFSHLSCTLFTAGPSRQYLFEYLFAAFCRDKILLDKCSLFLKNPRTHIVECRS